MIDPLTVKRELAHVRLPLDPTGRFADVLFVTDPQIGHEAFDEEEFRATLNVIRENRWMRWINGGDNWNLAQLKGHMGDIMTPRKQMEYGLQLYKPIAPQLIAAEEGNHEWGRITAVIQEAVPWYQWAWRAIGATNAIIPRAQEDATFVVNVGRVNYVICVMHSETVTKDKFQAAKDGESVRLVDAALYGNNHQKGYRFHRLFRPVNKHGKWMLQEFEVVEVAGGSFQRDPRYVRQKNKSLPGLGSLMLRLHADFHHIEVLDPRMEYPQHMVAGRYKPDTSFTLDNASVIPRRSRK